MTNRRFWDAYVESYVAREGFWHVPKQAVSRKSEKDLREKLRVMKGFEGKRWRSNQRKYANELRRKKLTKTKQAPSAFARVQKAVFDILGFANVDSAGILHITSVGKQFLSGKSLEAILQRQLRKLQLWNPAAVSKFRDYQILPHIFLLQVLLRMGKRGITRDEYLMFVCRATTHESLFQIVDYIRKYRKLGPHEREKLRKKVEEKKAKKGKSPFRAAALDYGYAMDLYAYPRYLSRIDDRLRITSGRESEVRRIVKQFESNGTYINFNNESDWFAYYGNWKQLNTVKFALAYYEDVSDIANLVDLLEEAQNRGILKSADKDRMIRESIIEDYLEHQLEKLESGLSKVGRQYRTSVGPIDLLARDDSGGYVVVELKRGRTSDRVVGQLLRYMGWVKENLKSKKPVRGIVVAGKADKGLKYAMKVAKHFKIGLKRYEFRVNFWDVE